MHDLKAFLINSYTYLSIGAAAIVGVWWWQMTPNTANATLAIGTTAATVGAFLHPSVAKRPIRTRCFWTATIFIALSLSIYYTLWQVQVENATTKAATLQEISAEIAKQIEVLNTRDGLSTKEKRQILSQLIELKYARENIKVLSDHISKDQELDKKDEELYKQLEFSLELDIKANTEMNIVASKILQLNSEKWDSMSGPQRSQKRREFMALYEEAVKESGQRKAELLKRLSEFR